MGAGSSVIVGDDGIKKEMEKPLDASDLLTLDDAVKEVQHLRGMLHDRKQEVDLLKHNALTNQHEHPQEEAIVLSEAKAAKDLKLHAHDSADKQARRESAGQIMIHPSEIPGAAPEGRGGASAGDVSFEPTAEQLEKMEAEFNGIPGAGRRGSGRRASHDEIAHQDNMLKMYKDMRRASADLVTADLPRRSSTLSRPSAAKQTLTKLSEDEVQKLKSIVDVRKKSTDEATDVEMDVQKNIALIRRQSTQLLV